MFSTFKNFLSKKDSETKSPENKAPDAEKKPGRIEELAKSFSFVGDAYNTVRNEVVTAKEKSKNLRQANYELGLKHLEKGNVSEAIFRFRLTKKFWPDLFDAYYQLAYCLTLNNKLHQAKDILEDLLHRNPNFDSKAGELLAKIKSKLN